MKPRFAIAAAVATALAAAVGGTSLAHEAASGIVKERMELMEGMGEAMKGLTAMMRGKEPYSAEKVRSLARQIADHGDEAITSRFPEGSLESPTEALPRIWEEWQAFSELANDVSVYAGALEAAAENPRGAGAGMAGGGMMGNGQGMMDGGMMSGGMMGGGMMGGGMMGGGGPGPDPELLAEMPPDAALMHLSQVCAACHRDFRKEQ